MQPLGLRPGAQRVPPKRIQPSLLAFLRPISGPGSGDKEEHCKIAALIGEAKAEEDGKPVETWLQERPKSSGGSAEQSTTRTQGMKERIVVDLRDSVPPNADDVSKSRRKTKLALDGIARRAPVRGVDYIADSEDENEDPQVLRQRKQSPTKHESQPPSDSRHKFQTSSKSASKSDSRPQAVQSRKESTRDAKAPQSVSSPSLDGPAEFPGFQTNVPPALSGSPKLARPLTSTLLEGSYTCRQGEGVSAARLERTDAQIKGTRMQEAHLNQDQVQQVPANHIYGPEFMTPAQLKVKCFAYPSGGDAAQSIPPRNRGRRVDASEAAGEAKVGTSFGEYSHEPALIPQQPSLQGGSRLREARKRARESESKLGAACEMPSFDLGIDSDDELERGPVPKATPRSTSNQDAKNDWKSIAPGGTKSDSERGQKAPPQKLADLHPGSEDVRKMNQGDARDPSLGVKSSALGHERKAGVSLHRRSSDPEKVVGQEAKMQRSAVSKVKRADLRMRDGTADDDIEEFSSPEQGPAAASRRRFSTVSPLLGLPKQSDAFLGTKQGTSKATPSFYFRVSSAEGRSKRKDQEPVLNPRNTNSSTFKLFGSRPMERNEALQEQAPGKPLDSKSSGVEKSERLQTVRRARAGAASLPTDGSGLLSRGKRPADDLFVAREQSSGAILLDANRGSKVKDAGAGLSFEAKKNKQLPGFVAGSSIDEPSVVNELRGGGKGSSAPFGLEEDDFDLVGDLRKRSAGKGELCEQIASIKKARAWSPPPPVFSSEEDEETPAREGMFSRGKDRVADLGGCVRNREGGPVATEDTERRAETDANLGGSAQNREDERGGEHVENNAAVRLLRERLSHYKPLSILMREGGFDNEPIFIDYRNQFMEIPSQGGGGRSYGAKSTSSKRKAEKNQAEGGNPGDKGRWTTLAGKKVYVDKRGKMLDGRAAYRTHLKDAGTQPKRRKRKARKKYSRRAA